MQQCSRDGASSREQAVASRRRVLTGTNRFANASEKALGRIDEVRIQTLCREQRRHLRHLRLRTEQLHPAHRRPTANSACGNRRRQDAGARSQFAADFLACAGLATSTQQFEQAEQHCRQRCRFDRALQFRCGVSFRSRRVAVHSEEPRQPYRMLSSPATPTQQSSSETSASPISFTSAAMPWRFSQAFSG